MDKYKINTIHLRYRLKQHNVTINELSKIIGISKQSLNKRIRNDNLKPSDILLILDITKVKFEEIFIRCN